MGLYALGLAHTGVETSLKSEFQKGYRELLSLHH
jgi:hypothetical protein